MLRKRATSHKLFALNFTFNFKLIQQLKNIDFCYNIFVSDFSYSLINNIIQFLFLISYLIATISFYQQEETNLICHQEPE